MHTLIYADELNNWLVLYTNTYTARIKVKYLDVQCFVCVPHKPLTAV